MKGSGKPKKVKASGMMPQYKNSEMPAMKNKGSGSIGAKGKAGMSIGAGGGKEKPKSGGKGPMSGKMSKGKDCY